MKVFLEGVALRWKTIAGTTVTLAGIFTFILYHYIGLKNEQISVLKEKHAHLEMRIKDLSEHGPFPQTAQKINESIKEIQKKLIPLSTLYIFDPLSGMAELGAEGGMRAIFSTRISLKIKEAYNFINQKKYDLASRLADDIEQELPDFLGVVLIRFFINMKKGDSYSEEALKYADKLVDEVYINMLSESSRSNMKIVYYWLIDYYIGEEKKKDAEELTLRAIGYWTEFKPFFEKTFGYNPTLN